MNYKTYLKELGAEVKSKEGVYTSRLALSRVIDNDIEKVGFSFPIYLIEFLESGTRLDLSFSYNISNDYAFGYCNMLFTEEMSQIKERLFNNYSFFDRPFIRKPEVFIFAELYYLHFVLIEVLPTQSNLWLLLPDGSTHKMNVTIEEYISFLLQTRGMYLGEAYLCPDFPEGLLKNHYDGFYENMEHLFGITPDQLPQCYHKEVVKGAVPVYKKYGKSLYEDFIKLFGGEIAEGTCSLSPSLEDDYERISPFPSNNAIEIITGFFWPKAYRQLVYDFGYSEIKFSRTTKEGRFISIYFLKPIDVFFNYDTREFNNDANIYLYGEKGKIPDFDGIYLFAVTQEYKFGMIPPIGDEETEVVMIDSVENQRLVAMPSPINTMDGFINRFLETKGEFLLDEIPL